MLILPTVLFADFCQHILTVYLFCQVVRIAGQGNSRRSKRKRSKRWVPAAPSTPLPRAPRAGTVRRRRWGTTAPSTAATPRGTTPPSTTLTGSR